MVSMSSKDCCASSRLCCKAEADPEPARIVGYISPSQRLTCCACSTFQFSGAGCLTKNQKEQNLTGRISFSQVPGFYDGVRDGMLDAALARLEASDEFQLDAYRAALGVPSFVQHTSKRCVPPPLTPFWLC